MAGTKFETSRLHSNSVMDTRKRTRILLVIATVLFFLVAIGSTNRAEKSLSGISESRSKQIPENKHVSIKDSQKALKQLQEIREDSKSVTADAQRKDVEHDPVSVNSIKTSSNTDTSSTSTSQESISNVSNTKKTATIVTCPACRLNALPSVKKFVYNIAPYFKPDLEINFIRGMDPILHLYEDGKEVQTVPLHSHTWETIVQKLTIFGIHSTSNYEPINEVIKKMKN